MNKYLIFIRGTTGVGKNTIVNIICNLLKDYKSVDCDKELNPSCSNEESYFRINGKKANDILKEGYNCIVHEWFEKHEQVIWILNEINEIVIVKYFWLTANIEEILKRNETKCSPIPDNIVKDHFNQTKGIVDKWIEIDTNNKEPLESAKEIIKIISIVCSISYHSSLQSLKL